MHRIKYFVFVVCIASSNCELRTKLMPAVLPNCPLLPVEKYSQTVVIDINTNTNPELKSCLVKTCGHSVVIINVCGKRYTINMDIDRKSIKTTDYPNIILITKHFTKKTADSGLLKYVVKSLNWSLLYFIVTGQQQYQCLNGTMSTSDMLLLDNIMNSIWHKFKIMRVIVAFPYTCEDKMLVYHGKRPSTDGDCLYDRPVKLINATNKEELLKAIRKSGEKLSENYPIKASIFERYPTSIKDCSNLHYYGHFNLSRSHGYCGLDGIVMNDLITHFNFNLSFPENETCNTYGFAVPGNLSGSLGCIARNELDISFNSRFMTLYSDEHIYYLHYVITDKLCAFVKRTGVIPIWHGAFNVYSPPSWMFIIGVIMIISVIIWGSAIVNKKLTGVKNKSCWYYLYHTLTMTMTGSSPMKQRTLLLMRGSCLAGSVLFLAVYQVSWSVQFTLYNILKKVQFENQLVDPFREVIKNLK
ncbi:hypothetical protein B5X24_HaOG200913 [Helicoverpa armigera]|uniref:Ionotropic receptor n=1 Tax=Helicoverpa armigera TaxID=29058 RepID=A0A2W1BDW5_HELAM|nr:hypothetical protein B5X24_HaOG200913 [Helicoverpa armigera]